MCVETIFVAICAPLEPSLSFTCGKLHMIASYRVVCEDTIAQCICHFGTCGGIGRRLDGLSIDLAELPKIRCAPCAALQDILAEARTGREIIESPLLTRVPVSMDDEAARDEHFAMLKGVWGGRSICPYHESTPIANPPGPVPATTSSHEPSAENPSPPDLEVTAPIETPKNQEELAPTTTIPNEPEEHKSTAIADALPLTPATPPSQETLKESLSTSELKASCNETTSKPEETTSTATVSDEPEEPLTPAVESNTPVIGQNMSPVKSTSSVNDSENEDIANKIIGPGLETSCWAPGKRDNMKSKRARDFPQPPTNVPQRASLPPPKVGPKARQFAEHCSGLRSFLTG